MHSARRSRRRGLRGLLALALTSGAFIAGPASPVDADEAVPTPGTCEIEDYEVPEGIPAIFCVEIHLRGGSVKFGNIESALADPAPIRQVLGLQLADLSTVPIPDPSGGGDPTFPTITVPGGILGGVPILESLPLGPLTDVTANIQPTGDLTTGEINIGTLFVGVGPLTTANLPFQVKVNNALLGDECLIGTTAEPVDLNLDLVLTENLQNDGDGIVSRMTASDTTFSIPEADGCGPLGLPKLLKGLGLQKANIFNSLINQKVGLPSGSGANHLTFADGYFTIAGDFIE
jgi:hypothetical protein